MSIDPVRIEQDTFNNLFALSAHIKAAQAVGINVDKDIEDLKVLAKQLTNNYLRNEEYNG